MCGGDVLDEQYAIHDDRYGYPGRFTIMGCRSCGAGFLANPLTGADVHTLYQRYYPPPPERAGGRGLLALVRHVLYHAINRSPELAFLARGGRVLDVGCGTGDSAAIVRLRGASWVGLEADARKVAAMRRAGLEAYDTPLSAFADRYAGAFDVVLASQLLEHLARPDELFEPGRRLLRAGGRLVLSTPNVASRYRARLGERWLNHHVPYHQVYYSCGAIETASARHGLAVVHVRTLTPATWRLQQRRYVRPPEGEPGRWCARPISFVALAAAGASTRLANLASGDGDCIVAVLEKR